VPHIVYTVHGFHFHEYGNKLTNFFYYHLEKFAGRFTDILITINEDDYKIAKEKNIVPNGRVVYIKGVGVDVEKLNPANFSSDLTMEYKKKLGLDKNDFLVIAVAELIKRKNLENIISAIKLVSDRGYCVRLLIAGDGVMEQQLRDFALANNLQNKVFFLGRRSDVPELLYCSDVLAMTSLHEGLPVAVMEAMAMEKPVVAYNIRGVRDLVVDGETGFLVKFGDVSALAEKIIFLISHPDFAKEMGKKGRKRIEENFSLDIRLKQMEALYKEILE
jgi:glycosyltransferase involved in cell wall biosynthesis